MSDGPVFGARAPGVRYVRRPSAYALVRDAAGDVAVVRTPRGWYLPGGGVEPGEAAAQAVAREAREECGLLLDVGAVAARAVQLVHAPDEAAWFEKPSVFHAATVRASAAPVESDHALHWLPPAEAVRRLSHESHRWAVGHLDAPSGGAPRLRVRPKAVCVCSDGDRILVNAAADVVTGERYYGPLGGEIEFGEYAADAVVRELREEIGVAVTDLQLLGVLENVFTYEGVPGHEIVFVYDARLADASLYARATLVGEESNGHTFVARWVPLATFAPGGPPLYPDGLYALLRARDA